jgi:transcriptional regulator with XRE-family HTH domain
VLAPSLITRARGSARLTQAELAARTGTSQAAISAYESGSREPSLNTLVRLLAACGHRLELVRDPGRPPTPPSRPQLHQAASTLAEVLDLAAALPVRHEPELCYPRLPTSSA